MYDEEYENEIIEQEFDDTGVVYEKPIELDIFAEDAWDDSALLAAFHQSLKMHPESNIVNEQRTVTKKSKKKNKKNKTSNANGNYNTTSNDNNNGYNDYNNNNNNNSLNN